MEYARVRSLLSPVSLVLGLAVLAAGLSAQTPGLELGKTNSGQLPEGQINSYSLSLQAKQYLQVVVTQPVRSATVVLYAPDGKKVTEIDTRNRVKPSNLVWVTDSAGEYRLTISGVGPYEIKLEELRAAGAEDGKRVEAERLLAEGIDESRKSSYDSAISLYLRAAGLFREVKEQERAGDAHQAAGAAYVRLNQYEKAIDSYERARAIRHEANDRQGESTSLTNLGDTHARLSQYEKAIGYYEQALKIRRDLNDRRAVSSSLGNLCDANNYLSRYKEAIGYCEEAIEISRGAQDRQGEGSALNNLANAYYYQGQFEKAIDPYERSLKISRDLNDLQGQGRALNNLALCYDNMGMYEKTISYYQQALDLVREAKDRAGEHKVLNNLGDAYSDLGQYDKAVDFYEQSLKIKREVRDLRGEAGTLENLGFAYSDLGQYDKAIGYFDQAMPMLREAGDRYSIGRDFDGLGAAYGKLNQHEKEIDYYQQALQITREVKDRDGEGTVLNDLGTAYHALGQEDRAIDSYSQALAISREVKDRRAEANELAGLMESFDTSGQPDPAILYGKQAVSTIQAIRADIHGLGPELQQSFLKANQKPYRALAKVLIERGRAAEAEQVLTLLKEEEFFELTGPATQDASLPQRGPDMTPEEARSTSLLNDHGQQLMAYGVEYRTLLAKRTRTPAESQRVLDLVGYLEAANRQFEQAMDDIKAHFHGGGFKDLPNTQAIMKNLHDLPGGTVAIITLIADDRFCAILLTPDAKRVFEYPIKASDLNRKIEEFRQVVQQPDLDPRPRGEELYRILVGGMASALHAAKAKTLMWSLDGELRYLPLAALYDGKRYLAEQYQLSVWLLKNGMMHLEDRPSRTWRAIGFGVTQDFPDSPALPAVSSELAGIIKTKPGEKGVLDGEIRLDRQFTRASLRLTVMNHYPVVHIASHFHFQPGDDTKSFLQLGDGEHMSLKDLRTSVDLFDGVQLLTLSACNTGVGDGSEVESFGKVAQDQGARAVVASLWPVEDESTSRLMQEFYRLRESARGTTKLEALEAAQMKLLHGEIKARPGAGSGPSQTRDATPVTGNVEARPAAPRFPVNPNAPYAHPFYWAPFFLMGNWL